MFDVRRLVPLVALVASALATAPSMASDFVAPWLRQDRALVLDGYEYNIFDLRRIAEDKRIVGFIHKGSDGVPPPYRCPKAKESWEREICAKNWTRYAVGKELYQTRRMLAKALGLKWGAYHLGRPGDPAEQARHFLDYAQPEPDDLVAIDIEDNDPEKWMSLADAERFAQIIKNRLGRYPILYTNGNTARYIADNRSQYPILSRLKLWYARYRDDIGGLFPKGHWQRYDLWQFAYHGNCGKDSCPYRVDGTNTDIDVNVAAMTPDQLRAAWPLGDLVPEEENAHSLFASADFPGLAPLTRAGLAGTAELAAGVSDRLRAYRSMGPPISRPGPRALQPLVIAAWNAEGLHEVRARSMDLASAPSIPPPDTKTAGTTASPADGIESALVEALDPIVTGSVAPVID